MIVSTLPCTLGPPSWCFGNHVGMRSKCFSLLTATSGSSICLNMPSPTGVYYHFPRRVPIFTVQEAGFMCLSTHFTCQRKEGSRKGLELFLVLQERGTQKTRHGARGSVGPEQRQVTWWTPQLRQGLSVWLGVQDPRCEGLGLSSVSATSQSGNHGLTSLNLTFFHL